MRAIYWGLALLLLAAPVGAQSIVINNDPSVAKYGPQDWFFPGSSWTSTGTLTPAEKGNVISMSHAEQGISYKGAEVYGVVMYLRDSKRYDWNNRTMEGVGVRLTHSNKHGMFRGGVAYLYEQRQITGARYSGLSVTVESWLGWGRRGNY